MASAEFHKAQAEELIKQVNSKVTSLGNIDQTLKLALVHATLATIVDKE